MGEPVQLLVGLGNPGSRYEQTRHNAGFWLLDALAARTGGHFTEARRLFGETARVSLGGCDCRLLKPTTFMNRSGQAVAALARFYRIPPEAILVVHDEIDLPPGTVRLKRGGGHGGHNGLRDIIGRLGSREFLRLRLGVGHPGYKDQVVDYVLHRPPVEEQTAIESAMDEALAVLPLVVAGELEQAMHRLHSAK